MFIALRFHTNDRNNKPYTFDTDSENVEMAMSLNSSDGDTVAGCTLETGRNINLIAVTRWPERLDNFRW